MALSPFEWFQVIGWSITVLGATGAFLWGRSRSEARESGRIKSLEGRMEKADAQTSRLASYVQGLPTTIEHRAIWNAIDKLREQETDIRERIARLEPRP